jgi:hypothetical protein
LSDLSPHGDALPVLLGSRLDLLLQLLDLLGPPAISLV